MKITDSKTIKSIQAEFQEKFPYLSLQFYAAPHREGEGSSAKLQLSSDKTIGEVRTVHREGDLEIDGQMTVAEFEKRFSKQFGLNVQVFRKSGGVWMQTTSTDRWTLEEQNRKGGSSEEAFIEKYGA